MKPTVTVCVGMWAAVLACMHAPAYAAWKGNFPYLNKRMCTKEDVLLSVPNVDPASITPPTITVFLQGACKRDLFCA